MRVPAPIDAPSSTIALGWIETGSARSGLIGSLLDRLVREAERRPPDPAPQAETDRAALDEHPPELIRQEDGEEPEPFAPRHRRVIAGVADRRHHTPCDDLDELHLERREHGAVPPDRLRRDRGRIEVAERAVPAVVRMALRTAHREHLGGERLADEVADRSKRRLRIAREVLVADEEVAIGMGRPVAAAEPRREEPPTGGRADARDVLPVSLPDGGVAV